MRILCLGGGTLTTLPEDIKNFCVGKYIRPDVQHNILTKVFSKILNLAAKINLNFCERLWCYWFGGSSEVYVELEAIK